MEPYNNSNNNANFANFNNQSAMNQMTQYMNSSENSLYNQNIDSTWKNMQNPSLNEINFNDRSNILSLINLPIVVPYHAQHPLINCKTPGRYKGNNCWTCNNCLANYSYNVPTFYCTACDFDLCQKCLLGLNAFMIAIYNYSKSNIYMNQQFKNVEYYKQNLHIHPIVRILREPTYTEVPLKCNMCLIDIQRDEEFYFCSLCNYCICMNCYGMNNVNKQFVTNPEYLSGNQMNEYPKYN